MPRILLFLLIGLSFRPQPLAAMHLDDRHEVDPVRYLSHHQEAGELMQNKLFDFVEYACFLDSTWGLEDYCNLRHEAKALRQVVQEIFSGPDSSVILASEGEVKPWDLKTFISGNFLELPNRQGVRGIDAIVDYFMMRNRFIQRLRQVQDILQQRSPRQTPELAVQIPYVIGYYMGHSPIASSFIVFDSIRCAIDERPCHEVKNLWGALNAVIATDFRSEIDALQARLGALSESQTENLQQLEQIKALAAYIYQGPMKGLEKEQLKKQLLSIAGSSKGVFLKSPYFQKLALQVVIYGELEVFRQARVRMSVYQDNVDAKTADYWMSHIRTLIAPSLKNIQRAIAPYAYESGIGEY